MQMNTINNNSFYFLNDIINLITYYQITIHKSRFVDNIYYLTLFTNGL